jgi:hypothetical protein
VEGLVGLGFFLFAGAVGLLIILAMALVVGLILFIVGRVDDDPQTLHSNRLR